jgi:hypothetical protein
MALKARLTQLDRSWCGRPDLLHHASLGCPELWYRFMSESGN